MWMLDEWYFTCCLRVDPKRAAVYLAIVETLDDPNADDATLVAALEELALLDVWMQIRCIPRLLALRSTRRRALLDGRIKALLATLIEDAADTIQSTLNAVITSVSPSGSDLEAAAAALSNLPRREPSEVPYFDLARFVGESLILAMLAHHPSAVIEDGALADLRDNALAGQFGRFAFILACRTGTLSRDRAVEATRALPGAAPHVEPDLLATLARACVQAGDLVDEVFRERLTLEIFHDLVRGRRRGAEQRVALTAMGLEVDDETAETLGVILWRAALADHASVVAPAATAHALTARWRVPGEPPDVVEVIAPTSHSKKNRRRWRQRLEALASRRGVEVSVRARAGDAVILPDNAPWLLSPLLAVNPDPDSRRQARQRYPSCNDALLMIRLLAAVLTAARLARRLEEPPGWLLELVVHAADVFRSFTWSFSDRQRRPDEPFIAPRLEGLLWHAGRATDQLGLGEIGAIGPDDFLALALSAEPMQTEDAAHLRLAALPEVALGWVIQAATRDDCGAAAQRWSSRISRVWDQFQAAPEVHAHRERATAQLVLHMLTERALPVDPKLDWRREKREWRARPHALLLSLHPPRIWLQPAWPLDRASPVNRLVIAVQRFASIQAHPEDDAAPERWKTDWRKRLDVVTRSSEVEPFVLYQLIKQLDGRLLVDDGEGQAAIALFVLEHGGWYALRTLFDAFSDAHASSIAREQALQALVGAMFQVVRRTERADRRDAVDPRRLEAARQRRELIARTLHRFVLESAGQGDVLRNRLAAQARDQEARAPLKQHPIALRLEEVARATRSTRDAVPPWALHGAVYDRELKQATLLYEEFRMGSCQDPFSARVRPEDLVARRAAQLSLASVVTEAGINCGLPTLIEAPTSAPPGTIVEVRLRGGEVFGQVDPLRSLAFASGRLAKYSGHVLQIGRREGTGWIDVADEHWEPDLSWRFAPTRSNAYPIRVADTHDLVPADGDLLDLLLDELEPDRAASFVLAFVAWVERLDGTAALRMSSRPGRNYVIDAEQFTEETWRTLADAIGAASTGLLVSFIAEIEDGAVVLRLAERSERVRVTHHRALQVPFDDRNLRWRDLLRRNQLIDAQRADDGRVYALETLIPGFPETIKLDSRGDLGAADVVSATVDAWSPRAVGAPQIKVRPIDTSTFELPKDAASHRDFFERYLAVKRGDTVTLVRPFGSITHDGLQLYQIAEGGVAHVEHESLTMGTRSVPRSGPRRLAQVIEAPWLPRQARRFPLDASVVPPELRQAQSIEGFIIKIPRQRGGQARCTFAWFTDDGMVQSTAVVTQTDWTFRLGARVSGERSSRRWTFALQVRHMHLRALWTMVRFTPKDTHRLSYLGVTEHEGLNLAERRPGELVEIPEAIRAPHLAEGDGARFTPRLPEPWKTEDSNSVGRKQWLEKGLRRAELSTDHSRVLYGITDEHAPRKRVRVAEVVIDIERAQRDGYLMIRRSFVLEDAPRAPSRRTVQGEARRAGAAPKSSAVSVDPDARWRKAWEAFVGNPTPISARRAQGHFTITQKALRAPTPTGEFTDRVELEPGQGQWIETATYPADARVMLVRAQTGEWKASARAVPPLSLAALRARFAPGPDGKANLPPLYYVGPEDAANGDVVHRFEWAIGLTICLPATRLRFDGRPFNQARFLLFHADAIRRARFGRDAQGVGFLDIASIDIKFSAGHSLYLQRKRHQMVHLLKLQRERGALRVDRVLGYETVSPRAAHREFEVSARLSERDSHHIIEQMDAADVGRSVTVLGRLDIGRFEESLGKRVRFEHVRMSFHEEADGPRALQNNELIFVRAGRIRDLGANERCLTLQPAEGLMRSDIGQDVSELKLLRRQFSVRVDLLDRVRKPIGAPRNDDALVGRGLLVRVMTKRRRVEASLSRAVPARLPLALASRIRAERGQVFCAVVDHGPSRLRLELEPGIYVELPNDALDRCPRGLQMGAVVRVEAARGNAFVVERAAYSHKRYVGQRPRPAVALPKNSLLKPRVFENDLDRVSFWSQEGVAIGDLAGLTAGFSRWDEESERWRGALPADCIQMMRRRHPKLVWLGLNGHRPVIDPTGAGIRAGGLSIKGRVLSIRWYSGPSTPLPWRFATFRDAPVDVIKAAIDRGRWRYHDRETGRWKGERVLPEPPRDFNRKTHRSEPSKRGLVHSVKDGPLFFDDPRSGPRLRYRPSVFTTFGLPTEVALHAIASERKGITVVVAARASDGGVWIELCPGRLAEVPANLFVHMRKRHAADDARRPSERVREPEISLARLDWSAFSPGDVLDLRSAVKEALEIDRIAVVRWRPGARGLLGNATAILPRDPGSSPRSGKLLLGSGKVRLSLPFAEPPQGDLFELRPDNVVRPVDGLRADRTALMIIEDGEIALAGSTLEPRWSNRQRSNDDPLAAWLSDRRLRIELVQAAGGALPVTIEEISGRIAWVSRRHQAPKRALPRGRMTYGSVIGLMPSPRGDAVTFGLVRAGNQLWPMPIERLVPGLPACHHRRLARQDCWLWLRGGDGRHQSGLTRLPAGAFEVEVVAVLGGDAQGLLCRSVQTEALFWLPARRAARITLDNSELKTCFKGRRLRVVLDKHGRLDALAVRPVEREYGTLRIGRAMTVRWIESLGTSPDGRQRGLVESTRSGVLLECDCDTIPATKELRAEVVERHGGRLRVTPIGQRRFDLDLPDWMQRGVQIPKSFHNFLAWRDEAADLAHVTAPSELDADALHRGLCHVRTRHAEDGKVLILPDVRLAQTWWERFEHAPCVPAHYALIVLAIFERAMALSPTAFRELLGPIVDNRAKERAKLVEASRALRTQLGRRALRSRHVEVIVRRWLDDTDAREAKLGLWRRLVRMEPALKGGIDAATLKDLRRLCEAVDLHTDADLQIIAAAIRAALGDPAGFDALDATREGLTAWLIGWHRLFPPLASGRGPELDAGHRARLLAEIEAQLVSLEALQYPIVLLPPVPIMKL